MPHLAVAVHCMWYMIYLVTIVIYQEYFVCNNVHKVHMC